KTFHEAWLPRGRFVSPDNAATTCRGIGCSPPSAARSTRSPVWASVARPRPAPAPDEPRGARYGARRSGAGLLAALAPAAQPRAQQHHAHRLRRHRGRARAEGRLEGGILDIHFREREYVLEVIPRCPGTSRVATR